MNGGKRVYLSVVAPACNEEDVIGAVVRSWGDVLGRLGRPHEIVITDDGSSDRTAEILEGLKDDVPVLKVVRFPGNRGYGPALAAAIEASRGDCVATIDADGQFDLQDVVKLLDVLESRGLDAVTGYRMGKKDSLVKVAADRALNLLVNLVCGVRFKDNNCALKVVRGSLIRDLPLNTCWLTPSEILVRMKANGYSVGQVGVTHKPRPGGRSKIRVIVSQCVRMVGVMFHLRMELYFTRHRMLFQPGGVRRRAGTAEGASSKGRGAGL